MESRDEGRVEDEASRKLEKLEKQLDMYRRLYRTALETLKVARRREATKGSGLAAPTPS